MIFQSFWKSMILPTCSDKKKNRGKKPPRRAHSWFSSHSWNPCICFLYYFCCNLSIITFLKALVIISRSSLLSQMHPLAYRIISSHFWKRVQLLNLEVAASFLTQLLLLSSYFNHPWGSNQLIPGSYSFNFVIWVRFLDTQAFLRVVLVSQKVIISADAWYGQIYNQCKERHLVAKFTINASSAIWWPNLKLMQVAPSETWIIHTFKQNPWRSFYSINIARIANAVQCHS